MGIKPEAWLAAFATTSSDGELSSRRARLLEKWKAQRDEGSFVPGISWRQAMGLIDAASKCAKAMSYPVLDPEDKRGAKYGHALSTRKASARNLAHRFAKEGAIA